MSGAHAPTALIAEDEPLMRARLLEVLGAAWPELTVVAQASNGLEALALFDQHAPRVVFLDIRMPGKSGIEVAEAIGSRAHIVFTTAYDEYAVAAFESGAVDYVLKPVEVERLAVTVARLQERLDQSPGTEMAAFLSLFRQAKLDAAPARMRWIRASLGNQVRLLAVGDVQYFQADTKYTRVVLADSDALIRTTLKELADGLDPEQFWQIHRSTIVNAAAIESVSRDGPEKLTVHLKGRRETLPVSRQFFHLFKQQ